MLKNIVSVAIIGALSSCAISVCYAEAYMGNINFQSNASQPVNVKYLAYQYGNQDEGEYCTYRHDMLPASNSYGDNIIPDQISALYSMVGKSAGHCAFTETLDFSVLYTNSIWRHDFASYESTDTGLEAGMTYNIGSNNLSIHANNFLNNPSQKPLN